MGRQGSGKSTFAKALGEKLGHEVIHLDKKYHKNGWERVTKEEWAETQKEILKKTRWIIDGTYLSSIDPRLEKADTAILLDLPARNSIFRAIRRYLQYRGKVRQEMNEGMHERVTLRFIRKITTFSPKKVIQKVKEYPQVRLIILKSEKEIEKFLESV